MGDRPIRHDSPEDGDFTGFVRCLDSTNEAPDIKRLGRLWTALRKALQSEIERRGLWHSPPTHLGVYGWGSWQQTDSDRPGPRQGLDDALEELVADCYAYIFVSRFQSLKAQLKVKPTVEGLVFRNIRNFLYERQKRHDPLGFRVFEVLRTAVARAVEGGRLSVVAGNPAIRNDTVLAFAPNAEPPDSLDRRFAELAAAWAEDLLPDLLTARGKAREAMLDQLGELLDGLPREGVGAFQVKPLLDGLKQEVRMRWATMFGQTQGQPAAVGPDGELEGMTRLIWPDTGFEERESFERLVECVDRELARLEVRPRTREYLSRLWGFLTSHAAESDPRQPNELPSRRRIAQKLGVPRERFPGLYDTLGDLIRTCRKVSSRKDSR